ncbi:hypothetical protein AB1Y20_018641 [Prymnesium parvum]|uniref:ERCC4 domain-containing protein n=1 Tax=Prymnesium parvum TaxID=97485 RepID=A0AB34JSV6_PRYPA
MAFLSRVTRELLEEDTAALAVLARGLGASAVLRRLVQHHCRHARLVFVLNTTKEEEERLRHDLALEGTPQLPVLITNECEAAERCELYRRGGLLFVTARILVVDLLSERVGIEQIGGFLVANAHRVAEASNVAFILRIVKQRNKTAFVKALSDDALALTNGFSRIEKLMRSLYARRLHLWPRFHMAVSEELEASQPNVEELTAPLSAKGQQLQHALLEAVDSSLKELRGINQGVDVSQLTLENSLFKSFDTIVRLQLEPVWHKVGRRTKALVHDLHTLRKLLNYLVLYDCVTFFEYLETLFKHASAQHPAERPHWVINCSDKVFTLARDRVYEIVRPQQTLSLVPAKRTAPDDERAADEAGGAAPADEATAFHLNGSIGQVAGVSRPPPLRVACVLEPCPKWELVHELLEEVNAARRAGKEGALLIVVKDEHAARTLREVLSCGARAVLEANFVKWVERQRRAASALVGTVLSAKQHEAKLLREARRRPASRAASYLTRAAKATPGPEAEGGGGASVGSRRMSGGRQSSGKWAGRAGRGGGAGREGGGAAASGSDPPGRHGDAPAEAHGGGLSAESVRAHLELLEDVEESTVICTHTAGAASVLRELQPRYVILYDVDTAFVRALEVAQATSPEVQMQVYFLMQKDSVEEQKYRSSLKAEKEAFQALIFEKSRMALPEEWDGRTEQVGAAARRARVVVASSESVATVAGNALTRRGGGRVTSRGPATVIVDVREFRSALPNMLHLNAIAVKPVTLEVGDYILTPEICVERKSVSDLTQSLASGRLFNQAEAMLRYYKKPALLIEFEEGKPFSLTNPSDVTSDISPLALTSKLSLLLLHFPKLRLLWSRSPQHTVAIFQALKLNQPEPDLAAAAAVGAANSQGAEQLFNMTPQDFLRQLPGVHAHNYRKLMNKVLNLRELSALSVEQLAAIIGVQNAKLLHDFLNRNA